MRFMILSVLIMILSGISQSTQSVTIIAGQEYEPGTRVGLPTTGVSFIIPRDWRGGMPPDQAVFILASHNKPGIGMAIMQTGMNQDNLIKFLSERQDLGDNIVLKPEGSPKITDSSIQMNYTHVFYTGKALAILGPHGNSVTFFFTGPTSEKEYYQTLLDKLIASVNFSKPEIDNLIKEWQKLLSGMMLKKLESYSSNDADGGYAGYRSEETVHLCSDGTYTYSSSTNFGVDGGGGASSGYDADSSHEQGKWQVVVMGNQAMLLLEASNGPQTHQRLAFDGERTFLDGNRVYRVKSDLCE